MLTKSKSTSLRKELKKQFVLLEELCFWLYDNRKKFGQLYEDGSLIGFDYPDCLGMPKKLSKRLNSHIVDIIQDHQEELKSVRSPTTVVRWFIDLGA